MALTLTSPSLSWSVSNVDVCTLGFFSCRRSAHDTGQGQLSVKALQGSRVPISLQVDGAEGRVCERSGPLDGGGLRQERVELTLGFLHSTPWWVEGGVAEGGSRVWNTQESQGGFSGIISEM